MAEDKTTEFINQLKERKQLYQNVFESPDGKKVLEDLSRTTFMNKTTFNDNELRMAFNEGQRSVILHIHSMMKIDIERTAELLNKQQQGAENE